MSGVEDDPLSRWFSGDELKDLFAGFPEDPNNKILQTQWMTEENLMHSQGEKRFVIRNSLARLDFFASRDGEILRWEAHIPKALQPDQSAESFKTGFEDTVFHRMPERLGYKRRGYMSQIISSYKDGSSGAITSNHGIEQKYNLAKEAEYLQFAFDFCRPKDQINSLFLRVTTRGSQTPSYLLVVNYPRQPFEAGMIGIYVPRRPSENSWSAYFTDWVVGTLANKRFLDVDKNTSSELSVRLTELSAMPSKSL